MSGSFPFPTSLTAPEQRPQNPSLLLLLCQLLSVNYPIPTNVKEVCVYSVCLLSSLRDFPALLSLASLTCHQWVSCNSLTSSLILMYKIRYTLAGVAQCTEQRPGNWETAGLIPSQGTCLGCRQGPQLGACDRQPLRSYFNVSLPLFHPPFSSI